MLTQASKDRAENAKAYIERKYKKLKDEKKERKEAWEMLISKMERLNLSEAEQELIK